jgi:hypothetical protein
MRRLAGENIGFYFPFLGVKSRKIMYEWKPIDRLLNFSPLKAA